MWRCSRSGVIAVVTVSFRGYRPTPHTSPSGGGDVDDAASEEVMMHHTNTAPKPRFRATMDAEVDNLINEAKRAAGTLVEEG